MAGTIDCNDIEYGTIVVKQNNAISTISDAQSWGDYVITGDILSHTLHPVNSHLECDVPSGNRYLTIPDTIELRSTTTDSVLTISEITVNDWADNISIMGTTLTIPANVKAGVYTGSFTVTDTY